MSFILPETELLKIKTEKKDPFQASFIFEPLAPGYGLTIAHALRRVLLSSLSGAAITEVKIEGVTHEFSTLSGVKEDVIEIILNLKSLRLKLLSEEPAILKLNKKGPGEVLAADFEKNPQVEVIDPKHHLATLDKKGKLTMEAQVKKGRGYQPTEARSEEKLPLGTIALDAIFTPIKKIHYHIENTRVGGRTDFDKLTLDITTDGTIDPEEALFKASQTLIDHFDLISKMKIQEKQPRLIKEKKAKKVQAKRPVKAKKKEIKKKPIKKEKAVKSTSRLRSRQEKKK